MDHTDEMLDDVRRMRQIYPPETHWQRVIRLGGLGAQPVMVWLRDAVLAVALVALAIVIGSLAPGRSPDHTLSNSVLVLAIAAAGTLSAKSAILAGTLSILTEVLIAVHPLIGLYHALTCLLAVGLGVFIAYLLDSKRLRSRRGAIPPFSDDHFHD